MLKPLLSRELVFEQISPSNSQDSGGRLSALSETPPESLGCPFCESRDLRKVRTISRSRMLAEYKKLFGITFSPDVIKSNFGFDSLRIYECNSCRAQTFWPKPVADATYYEALSACSGYYAKNRWEYSKALEIFAQHQVQTFLEIGCGDGHFLRLAQSLGYTGFGTDLNAEAIAKLKTEGFNVSHDLSEWLADRSYDAFVMFQVLEHIPDPCRFLRSILPHLRKHGVILVSTPVTPSCSACVAADVLQLPPHHQSLPSAPAYEKLAGRLGCKCESIAFDPPNRFQIEFGIRREFGWLPFFDRYINALGRFVFRGASFLNCNWAKVGHTILVVLCAPDYIDL